MGLDTLALFDRLADCERVWLAAIARDSPCPVLRVDPATEGNPDDVPERVLSEWFARERGEEVGLWTFAKTGVVPDVVVWCGCVGMIDWHDCIGVIVHDCMY